MRKIPFCYNFFKKSSLYLKLAQFILFNITLTVSSAIVEHKSILFNFLHSRGGVRNKNMSFCLSLIIDISIKRDFSINWKEFTAWN